VWFLEHFAIAQGCAERTGSRCGKPRNGQLHELVERWIHRMASYLAAVIRHRNYAR